MRRIMALLLSLCLVTVIFTGCENSNQAPDETEPSGTDPVSHTHTYSAEWTYDAEGHWHVATCEHSDEVSGYAAHSWDEGTVTLQPTENTDGERTYTCSVCGTVKTEPVAMLTHTHSFVAEWTYDEVNHWHECSGDNCSEKEGLAVHTWDEGTVTLQPTENADGERTYTCSVCGGTKTESIPKLVSANSITTNGGAVIELSALTHQNSGATSTVYYISDITPEALTAIYNALSWSPSGKVGIKLSTGEPPASNYLDPDLIKNLVQSVDGTIVECNTAYGGSRASTAAHYQVAEDHGYTAIAPVQILDENGSMALTVNGGQRLSENYVGAAFADYDSYIVLSHFKGHSMAGFGGAMKNISIGFGSVQGKCWIHSAGTSKTSPWGGNQDAFCEAMADAGKAVSDFLGNGEQIIYINVMNNLSIDCDCNGHPAAPDIHNIGILASTDPVALDQACIDLIWVSEGNTAFVNRVNNRNGLHTLESGEKIGLGSRSYKLTDISDTIEHNSIYTAAGIVSASDSGTLTPILTVTLSTFAAVGIFAFVLYYVVNKKRKNAVVKSTI